MAERRKYGFKISVIGDSQVGKTSLMRKFTNSPFDRAYDKTLGVKVSLLDNEIEGNIIRLQFWDIAGGKEYHFLRPSFYRNSIGAIIVFSLEDNELGKESFNRIPEWHREITKNCGEIPVYIFANKVDLVEENKLDESNIKNLVEENNLRGYYLTSAISGNSFIELFKGISEDLFQRYKELHPDVI
ncbi:MAG: Rab family GTPase [Promethearchaeota archaeon]|jgi:small GTP-binding protein